jgi:succinyl-diaminopimelate desuccinylase
MQENASLLALLRALVRIPTRSGIDEYAPIFRVVQDWLNRHGVAAEMVSSGGKPTALIGRIEGGRPAQTYVLNATVDTAGFGDSAAWSYAPTSATIGRGWLYGRGAADSKAGVAIFCHVLAAHMVRDRGASGPLAFVFDADEHVGRFTGISDFLQSVADDIAGVFIGYPGFDRICAGARGFARTTITVHGTAGHSGSSRREAQNAIVKAAALVERLTTLDARLCANQGEGFPLAAQVTVTGIRGGGEFSMVPDRCEIDVDIRLTPNFSAGLARAELKEVAAALDRDLPTRKGAELAWHETWPPYMLAPTVPLVQELVAAAESVLGRTLPVAVAGPSNIGNLLAARGIPATCGFGAAYRNVHAPDECVELATLEPVYRIYRRALFTLLDGLQGAAR